MMTTPRYEELLEAFDERGEYDDYGRAYLDGKHVPIFDVDYLLQEV